MRTRPLFALLPAVLAAAACSTESVPPPPAAPVNWRPQARLQVDAGPVRATDKERAAAGAYAKALVSPGFAQLGAALDEDAHFAFAGMKDAHGRDKVVQAHQALLGAFEKRSFVTTRIWLTDSAQAFEWTMTGVQAKDWLGVPATQKQVVIKGITMLWTNDDGSITDVHVNFDEALVKAQLGAGPKELQALAPAQAAAAGSAPEFEQARNDEETANVTQVRAALGALEKADEQAYLATMTDDVEVNLPERAQPMRGKDQARAYLKTLKKQIAELDTSIDNIWGVQKFVVVEYYIVGTQMAPIGWIPLERDRLLKMSVVDVIEMRDGKMALVSRYDNPVQVLTAP